MFERYAIVSQTDIAEAIGRLEPRDGHSLGHSLNRKKNNLPKHRPLDNCISLLLLGWCREGESNPQDPKVGGF